MVFFVLFFKLFIFIFLGGLSFFAVITRFFIREADQEKTVFFYALGMGPPIASLLLYYLFLVVPEHGSLFYLGIILSVFILMISLHLKAIGRYLFWFKKIFGQLIGIFRMRPTFRRYFFGPLNISIVVALLSFMLAWRWRIYLVFGWACLFFMAFILLLLFKSGRTYLKTRITTFFQFFKAIFSSDFDRRKFTYYNEFYNYLFGGNNFFVLILLVVSVFALKNLLLSFSLGHDFLEYMVQGGYIFDNKAIIYTHEIYNEQTGFYYVGLHGWSFPLQYSLERLVDSFTTFGFGLYFQSLTLWYGLVILTVVYSELKKHFNTLYAISGILIMVFAKGFLIASSYSHIDSYRIFFFSLSVIFTLEMVNKPEARMIPLLAFVAGTSAFAHSLGVIVAVVLGATLVFYLQKDWVTRIKYALGFGLLTLVFGGIHYLLDIFYGTGWIFKEIDFY